MKFSIDDLLKNPILILIVVIIGACLTLYMNQNFASVGLVNNQAREMKTYVDEKHHEVHGELREIKSMLRDQSKNILDIYQTVKYQEGKYERK